MEVEYDVGVPVFAWHSVGPELFHEKHLIRELWSGSCERTKLSMLEFKDRPIVKRTNKIMCQTYTMQKRCDIPSLEKNNVYRIVKHYAKAKSDNGKD